MDDDGKDKNRKIHGKHKKGRLIIRNLSFKINEKKLKEEFSKFGEIIDIKIPTKPDGKMRGFGFVEFEKTASAIKAINALNAKELLGRAVAIDFALSKDKYEKLMTQKSNTVTNFGLEEEEKSTDEENWRNTEMRNLKRCQKIDEVTSEESWDDYSKDEQNSVEVEKSGSELEDKSSEDDENSFSEEEEETEDEEEEETEDEEEKDDDESPPKKRIKTEKSCRPNDTHEGKTVFVRNLSFDTTADNLKEAMSRFGLTKYCLLCIDKLTDYPKGTAFVQFVNKEDAEKCLSEMSEPGKSIILDGRKLNVSIALDPEQIRRNKEENEKKGKDNRNLKLLSEGLIRAGSDAAKGISQADIKKRLEVETYKKRLLKNLHYFISPVRLCVHNLPPHVDDNKLKVMFLKAAGPEAKVTGAKVMRNLKILDDHGVGMSKGFGFVGFTKHEDALQALRKLNNNPDIFTPNKRPIVEFAVENRQILNAKKHQVERQQGKLKFFTSNKKEGPTNLNVSRIKVQKEMHFKGKNKNNARKNKMKKDLSKEKFKKKGKMKKMKRKNFIRGNKLM